DGIRDLTVTGVQTCALPISYGPTGVGDDWVRIGPLKTFMDGGMLIGTAYMRTPWGVGPTYQITQPSYRGILYPDPEMLTELYLEIGRASCRERGETSGVESA